MAGPVVVCAADLHMGCMSSYGMGHVSWDEQQQCNSTWAQGFRALDQLVDLCLERDADYLAICGDTFDNGNPDAEVVARFTEALDRLGRTRVVMVNGNHDQRHVIASHRTPVDVYAATHPKVLKVADGPEMFTHEGFSFAMLPWTRVAGRSRLNDDLVRDVQELAERFGDGPGMFMSHCVVDGVDFVRGSEEIMSPGVAETPIPVRLLDSGPWASAQLGHVHTRQELGAKTFYTGSTFKISFKETDEAKGASVLTFDDDGGCDVEFAPFTVRDLWQWSCDAEHPLPDDIEDMVHTRDLVRITTDDPDRDDVKQMRRTLLSKGVEVDVRKSVKNCPSMNVRVPGMSTSVDPVTALKAYAAHKNTPQSVVDAALSEFGKVREA